MGEVVVITSWARLSQQEQIVITSWARLSQQEQIVITSWARLSQQEQIVITFCGAEAVIYRQQRIQGGLRGLKTPPRP